MSKLYVVTMHKWSSLRKHTYAVGAFRSIDRAYLAGEDEAQWRGGVKYDYKVTHCPGNNRTRDTMEWPRGRPGEKFQRQLAVKRWINMYQGKRFGRSWD